MKKNIFIIILCILVLGLGGYLVYDKIIDKKDATNTDKNKNDIEDLWPKEDETTIVNPTNNEGDEIIDSNDDIETSENDYTYAIPEYRGDIIFYKDGVEVDKFICDVDCDLIPLKYENVWLGVGQITTHIIGDKVLIALCPE